jgi:hypothetical protein
MLVFQMVSSENAVYTWIEHRSTLLKKTICSNGRFFLEVAQFPAISTVALQTDQKMIPIFRGGSISSHLYKSVFGGGSISSRL